MTSQVFIVAAARSGAGLFHSLFLLDKNFHSGALSEDDKIASLLEKNLAKSNYEIKESKANKLTVAQIAKLQSEYKGTLSQTKDVFVDYNPRLATHITQLASTFAEAKFIFVTRSPAQTIWSSRRAWESKKFVSHPDLPEWWGEPWAFNLIPNWRELIGQPMLNIVASQWAFYFYQVGDNP